LALPNERPLGQASASAVRTEPEAVGENCRGPQARYPPHFKHHPCSCHILGVHQSTRVGVKHCGSHFPQTKEIPLSVLFLEKAKHVCLAGKLSMLSRSNARKKAEMQDQEIAI